MGYTSADSDSSNSVLLKEEYRREGQYHDSTEEGSSADEMIRKFGGHNERSVRDCTGAKTDVALLREKGRNKDAIHNVEDEEYGDEEMYEADELEEDEVEEEDEEEEIEESVAEDMAHFVHTFKGIESQYRLINRIGEGKLSYLTLLLYCEFVRKTFPARQWLTMRQGPFQPYTKPKTYNTTPSETTGMTTRKKEKSGHRHPDIIAAAASEAETIAPTHLPPRPRHIPHTRRLPLKNTEPAL